MPLLVACPKCRGKIELEPADSDQKMQCPLCGVVFLVKKKPTQLGASQPPGAANAVTSRPPRSAPPPPSANPLDDLPDEDRAPRKRRRDEDEDDDDRPRKRRRDEVDEEDDDRPSKRRRDEEDEDDDRPRKRRRDEEDEDDDDRPRKRRRDEEDEEDDDRPRKKRREEDDGDDDDRPRKRRRDEEDDDDDVGPRRRGRQKQKSGSGSMMLILVLGGAALFLVMLVGIGLFLWLGVNWGTNPDALLSLAPADSTGVGGINVGPARQSASGKKAIRMIKEKMIAQGVAANSLSLFDDIDRFIVAGDSEGTAINMVMAASFTKSHRDEFKKYASDLEMKPVENQEGIYQKERVYFVILDDSTCMLANVPGDISAIAANYKKTPKLSADLLTRARQVQNNTIWGVVGQKLLNSLGIIGAARGMGMAVDVELAECLRRAKTVLVSCDLTPTGKDTTLELALECASGADAEKVKKFVDDDWTKTQVQLDRVGVRPNAKMIGVENIIDDVKASFKATQQAATVSCGLKFGEKAIDEIYALSNKNQGFGGGNPFGNPNKKPPPNIGGPFDNPNKKRPFVPGQTGKATDINLRYGLVQINGNLAVTDPVDNLATTSVCKVYALKMTAGKIYQIDMKSKSLAYLRLEDSRDIEVASTYDTVGKLDASITFPCTKTDTYRIVAANEPGEQAGRRIPFGPFTLTVVEK